MEVHFIGANVQIDYHDYYSCGTRARIGLEFYLVLDDEAMKSGAADRLLNALTRGEFKIVEPGNDPPHAVHVNAPTVTVEHTVPAPSGAVVKNSTKKDTMDSLATSLRQSMEAAVEREA